jgi:hypothetical protein
MKPSKQVNLRLDRSKWDSFEVVASGSHLIPTKYAVVCLSVISDLKPEHALDALSSIPKEYFRDRQAPATLHA